VLLGSVLLGSVLLSSVLLSSLRDWQRCRARRADAQPAAFHQRIHCTPSRRRRLWRISWGGCASQPQHSSPSAPPSPSWCAACWPATALRPRQLRAQGRAGAARAPRASPQQQPTRPPASAPAAQVLIAQTIGLLLGAIFMNPKTAQTVSTVLMLTFMLVGARRVQRRLLLALLLLLLLAAPAARRCPGPGLPASQGGRWRAGCRPPPASHTPTPTRLLTPHALTPPPRPLPGGYYVRAIPAWISWVKYLSFLYWGFNLCLRAQFTGAQYYDCGPDGGAAPGGTAAAAQAAGPQGCVPVVDFSGQLQLPTDVDGSPMLDVLILLAMLLALRLAVYAVLRHKTK
jgi:hypothetical protein